MSDVYSGFRRRNLLVSGLVLVILLAALAVLIVSTERACKLAHMQAMIAVAISHELRTPLASLRVAADDLKSGHVENVEQARHYGEVIDAQSRRLSHVVDQALFLTGQTQSSGSLCLRAISVAEIFSAAVNALAPKISEAQIEVEKHIAPGVPRILADPELVLRCLTNLAENAIKYAGSGRWILLSAARGGRHSGRSTVEVTVEDRGPGIRDDEATAVFEPFYRGRSVRQSRETGSGLGLAIVRSVVEAYGGWIRLERAVPHGCKFRLFFSLMIPLRPTLRTPRWHDNALPSHPTDDDSLATLLGNRLRREGYDIKTCGDGAQAEQLLKSHSFDVILLDVMLPQRSGFEFCEELRDRGIQTPILMLTARGDVTDRVTGLRIGADDYLPKPFDVSELLARIEALRRRAVRNGRVDNTLFEFGDVCVNFDTRSVSRSGQPVELSRREFQMLSYLIRSRERVVLRNELLPVVWGYSKLAYTRTLDVHMWQLRRKLEADPQKPRFLRTVHGTGYLSVQSSASEKKLRLAVRSRLNKS